MRWPKILLLLVVVTFVSAVPFSAHALRVKFCAPSCPTGGADIPGGTFVETLGPGVRTDFDGGAAAGGITITVVEASGLSVGPFTITATVTADQSGTIQQIIFNPTTVATGPGSGCRVPDLTQDPPLTNPCRLEIVAISDPDDFPLLRPPGGYPAGVFKSGFFLGPQDPNAGDSISMSGATSGLSGGGLSAVVARDTGFINVTPGPGTGDTPVSLPSACTGDANCKFIANDAAFAFYDSIEETVQHTCDEGQNVCGTQLETRLNVEITTEGNILELPCGTKRATQAVNGTVALVEAQGSSFKPFNVLTLAVAPNDFAVAGNFTLLGTDAKFDALTEEVFLKIGSFAMIIPANKFVKPDPRVEFYAFFGKVKEFDVAATIVRDWKTPKKWWFGVGAHGVALTGLSAGVQTNVEFAIGNDSGAVQKTPSFIGN